MSFDHKVQLLIINKSKYKLTFVGSKFIHGNLAKHDDWPDEIDAKEL